MLITLAVVMILIACLGALMGGDSFGQSLRKGCGCSMVWIVLGIFVVLFLFFALLGFA